MKSPRTVLIIETTLLAIASLAINLIELNHPPMIDEMHHVLAARSLLDNGTLQVGESGGTPYTRASLFTYTVAGLFKLFGESWAVARMPSVVASAILVSVLFLWVRKEVNRKAAWISAILLCIYPTGIYLSQLCRFYTMHALVFFLGVLTVYAMVHTYKPERHANNTLLIISTILLFLISLHLQSVTLIGLSGISLWAAGVTFVRLKQTAAGRDKIYYLATAGIALLIVASGIAVYSGAAEKILHMFSYSDLWAANERRNFRYYHWQLLGHYPTLWTLFPLILFVSIRSTRSYSSPAVLCSVVFISALVLHSIAAWKQERYLFYAMPFFFVICGIALAQLIDHINWKTAVIVLGFAAIGNPAFSETFKMLFSDEPGRPYRGEENWSAALPSLQPLIRPGTTIISSSDLKALYYLGRVDYVLLYNHRFNSQGALPEFGLLREVNRPVISTPESIKRIENINNPAGVIVIIERSHWRMDWGVPLSTANYLESAFEKVRVPLQSGLVVFRKRVAHTPQYVELPRR